MSHYVKKEKMKVAQSCPTLCDPMDYTVHGILQARILEWVVAFPFSRGSSQPRDRTQVSLIAGGFFTSWATRIQYVRISNLYSVHFILFFICSEFCHTLKWISHGFTCVPHPDPPSHLPLHPLPLGFPSAPGPSACLMHPTWAGDLFHPRYYTCFDAVLLKHPTLAFSHRVQKSVLYICVSFSILHIGLSLPSF